MHKETFQHNIVSAKLEEALVTVKKERIGNT